MIYEVVQGQDRKVNNNDAEEDGIQGVVVVYIYIHNYDA